MADEKKKAAPLSKKGVSRLFKMYYVSGEKADNRNKSCPKCGAGVAMARHKDRNTCGKCGYTEFSRKEVKEEKKGKRE